MVGARELGDTEGAFFAERTRLFAGLGVTGQRFG
jgi:hypothetical protein